MRVLVFIFLIVFTSTAYCQSADVRFNVNFQGFTFEDGLDDKKPLIDESVLTNLNKANRVNVYVNKSADAVTEAISDNMDASDVSTWELYNTSKAGTPKYTITGALNSVNYMKFSRGGYKCKVNFTIRIIDLKTQETVSQIDIESSEAPVEVVKSAAALSAIKTTSEQQIKFFQDFFSLRIGILKLDEEKKGQVKSLTVIGGLNNNLVKGDAFVVKHISEINGFEVEEEVAFLKLSEVGKATSKCTVSKGGEKIKSLFEEQNDKSKLICEYKKKK